MKYSATCAASLLVGLATVFGLRLLTAAPEATAPAATKVEALVKQLDSDKFAAREAADKALRQFGIPVVPLLQKELQGRPALEVRRRLEKIIADLTRLDWRKDLASAVKEASKSGKPILVYSTIGEPNGFA